MKLTAMLMLIACLHAGARGFAQRISLSEKNAPLEKVFNEIKKQTGYSFAYRVSMLKNARSVSIQVSNGTLDQVLGICFSNQPFTYTIIEQIVVIKPDEGKKLEEFSVLPQPIGEVRGLVTGDNGPLSGAYVVVKSTGLGTSTNIRGEFTLQHVEDNDVLVISFVGYEKQMIPVKDKQGIIFVQLKPAVNKLDEIQVLAYGQATSRRYSTGSIARVTSEDISKQPVTNILQAAAGRMAGVVITQTNGLPGSDITFQVRGQNSIATNFSQLLSNPLVIVDGVPYPGSPVNYSYNNGAPTSYLSPIGSGSPLYNLNPNDIESIEILKDADATAIYGSRAANGVMLITTKKGKQGKTRMEANVRTGVATNLRRMDMLTTPEYLALRRQAFANSGITPTASNAPDLFVWDTTQTIDWQKKLLGRSAHTTDANVSLSGGGAGTSFMLSGNYNEQSSIFPDNRDVKRGSMHLNVNHTSADKKLQVTVSMMAAASKNILPQAGYTSMAYTLPPNFPIYDSTGKLNWVGSSNPNASLLTTYTSKGESLTGNILVRYAILAGLDAKVSLGYSRVQTSEEILSPGAAQDPSTSTLNSHTLAMSVGQTTTVEPQLEYTRDLFRGRLNVLAGGTLQKNIDEAPVVINSFNYGSDLYLSNLSLAGSYTMYNGYNAYQYASFFGRLNYNWQNKYILNGSFRRDGSSRFGPNALFGNFGAVGAAWLFSNEPFAKKIPWLSFGKLRSSLGWVGSDNIPNYTFMSSYTNASASLTYNGVAGLVPSRIANANYRWESTEKLEAALELGFLKDRMLFSAAWFSNRSGNQLVGYPLSAQTGFTSYTANLNAVVQNTGLELELNTTNIKTNHFTWTTVINLTMPSNKVVSFPGIEGTSYVNSYVVGKPLASRFLLHYLGKDSTGAPRYYDGNKNGSYYDISGLAAYGKGDLVYAGNSYPKYYGGIQNGFSWKNFRLDIFLQFRYGLKSQDFLASSPPVGGLNNVNRKVLNEIRSLGLESNMITTTTTIAQIYYKAYSDASFSDASFLRLQNVSLSWMLSDKYLKPIKMSGAKVYVQAQNLYVWSHFKGFDPESGATGLPPLFTLIGGVQFSF